MAVSWWILLQINLLHWLPNREENTLTAWLKERPEIQIVPKIGTGVISEQRVKGTPIGCSGNRQVAHIEKPGSICPESHRSRACCNEKDFILVAPNVENQSK